MSDYNVREFERTYPETAKTVEEIHRLADQVSKESAGSSAEKEAAENLRDVYLKSATNPALATENQRALDSAHAGSHNMIESFMLSDMAKSNCSNFSLLHARMVYDYFAEPKTVPLVWPKCESDVLKKLDVMPPYEDQSRTTKTF